MRSDMQKLICERPRRGSRYYNTSKKTGKRLDPRLDYDDDYDSGPKRTKASRRGQYGWNCKELNENLQPLVLYLYSNVGRKWDDVYSEIRAQIDHRRAIGFHVLQHLGWEVERNVIMYNGDPYSCCYSYGNGYRKFTGLYVNPETGILCRTANSGRWRYYNGDALPDQ